MNILYLECNMGIAGDMFLSALIDLFENKEQIIEELNQLGIPGVKYHLERTPKCGITGSHIRVLIDETEEKIVDIPLQSHSHDTGHEYHHSGHGHSAGHEHHHSGHGHSTGHEHHHSGMKEISGQIESLNVSEKVKTDAMAIYQIIAEAESMVHGKEVTQIHFHEVGTKDAIADIAGAAYLMEKIHADKVMFSPIATGYGMVKCAHGILPVPAPATALILRGIPSYSGKVEGEQCTPTGAALANYFADDYGERPLMKIGQIGYGMGTKDFEQANCVRAFWGEAFS